MEVIIILIYFLLKMIITMSQLSKRQTKSLRGMMRMFSKVYQDPYLSIIKHCPVFILNKKVVGFALWLNRNTPTPDVYECFITSLFVSKKYRRLGIATKLLSYIIKDTQSPSVGTGTKTQYLQMFKNLGFTENGIKMVQYYSDSELLIGVSLNK
jgi:ribosomal protein S18 acetylase RimI-like enzyme